MVKYAGWFLAMEKKHYADPCLNRETTSIPVNPRTTRPVGYAFVDLKSSDEAQKAIDNLSGKDILDRKVSVQLARKPEAGGEKTYEGRTTEGGERTRGSGTRGRGLRRGRGARGTGRGGRGVCQNSSTMFGIQH